MLGSLQSQPPLPVPAMIVINGESDASMGIVSAAQKAEAWETCTFAPPTLLLLRAGRLHRVERISVLGCLLPGLSSLEELASGHPSSASSVEGGGRGSESCGRLHLFLRLTKPLEQRSFPVNVRVSEPTETSS